MADEPNYTKPTSQVDLERRLDNGNESNRVLTTSDEYASRDHSADEGRDYRVEDNDTSDYYGVSPEYQTYANETEKPAKAEDGPEAEIEKRLVSQTVAVEEVDEDEEPLPRTTQSRTTSSSSPTTPSGSDDSSSDQSGSSSSGSPSNSSKSSSSSSDQN